MTKISYILAKLVQRELIVCFSGNNLKFNADYKQIKKETKNMKIWKIIFFTEIFNVNHFNIINLKARGLKRPQGTLWSFFFS